MRKLFYLPVVAVIFTALLIPRNVVAMMHVESGQTEEHNDVHETLDEVLPELLGKYNKDTVQELDCESLTDKEFERVGDAVMESMHPGEAHERMDAMMGGEGSESLKQMHIQMGKRYFGCDTAGFVGDMMRMNGFGGMMGTKSLGNKWPMTGSSQLGSLHGFLAVITWISFIAFLLAGTRWFWKKANK